MRALVTGGCGFIGSHLVDKLLDKKAEVMVIDNLSSGNRENIPAEVEFYERDLKEMGDIDLSSIDIVYHLAASSDVRAGLEARWDQMKENLLTTCNLLERMVRYGLGDLVFASTSAVYGESFLPVKEDHPLRPISIYGSSKLACEAMLSAYAHLFDLRVIIFRLANVVGPRAKKGVIPELVEKVKKAQAIGSEELEILGDGTQRKSYLYVEDCIEGFLTPALKGYDIYNLGSVDSLTVDEVADAITDELGVKLEYRYKKSKGGRGWLGDAKEIELAIDKLRAEGWSPKHDSEGAVRRTVREITR
jgi:UDP-glucose 4-epimerase